MARAGLCSFPAGTPAAALVILVLRRHQRMNNILQQNSLHLHVAIVRRIAHILAALPEPALRTSSRRQWCCSMRWASTGSGEGAALRSPVAPSGRSGRLTLASRPTSVSQAVKYGDPRFENASVGFDLELSRPLNQLHGAFPGRSNCLAIAAAPGLSRRS